MTPDKIQATLADSIGKAILGKTATAGATDAAAAVMALVGPKPLVWEYGQDFTYRTEARSGAYLCGYYRTHYRAYYEGKQIGRAFDTLKEAQAAAQAHADAAHWGRMVLADTGGGAMMEWQPIETAPKDIVVMTKIHDQNGERNIQALMKKTRDDGTTIPMWWYSDGSMYVYYQPTHWQPRA